jgi:hypothetical protein
MNIIAVNIHVLNIIQLLINISYCYYFFININLMIITFLSISGYLYWFLMPFKYKILGIFMQNLTVIILLNWISENYNMYANILFYFYIYNLCLEYGRLHLHIANSHYMERPISIKTGVYDDFYATHN